ncbi:MAG: substrate-binding domain-containing protein [Magnetococcales bacterium]|nr:substrate-binding domain-containing protein [Magnetococcales bacterium]MBF0321930.1 substrate-binding domain-containing protein [Magnetococcales bacterium]
MKNNHFFLPWCCMGFLLLVGSTAWADPIRISGTGALLSSVKQVTDIHTQRHPDVQTQFIFPPIGSSGAIKAVANKQLDIALSGRPLKKEEESADLKQTWLGRSPFIFVVHKASPTTKATFIQLIEWYSGRQKTWPDGAKVRVVLRPPSDTDTAILRGISPSMDEAITSAYANRQPGSSMADTDIDLVDMVEKVPGGLGSVALPLILAERRPLKGLILDGVEPTVSSMDNNSYKHVKQAFLIVRADAPSHVRAIIEFLLTAEAKDMLLKLGISSKEP